MKPRYKMWPGVKFSVILFSILLLSFFSNIFGLGPNEGWFEGFQEDSALITKKTAACKGENNYTGPLIPSDGAKDYTKVMTSDACSESAVMPYHSQFGLQARMVSLFAPEKNGLERYYKIIQFLLAAFTALVVLAISLRIYSYWGKAVALMFTSLVALSPWVVAYARNLYWFEPFMLLPFAVAFCFYEWFRHRSLLWLFYVVEFLLILVKLLNGYEHVTTILLSVFVPILFYETLRGRSLGSLFKPLLVTGGVGVAAFATAFVFNVWQLSLYYGSWDSATAMVRQRSDARSIGGLSSAKPHVIANFRATLPETYNFTSKYIDLDGMQDGSGPMYKYLVVSLINYAFLPAINFPVEIKGFFGDVIQSVLFWTLLAFLCLRMYLKQYLGKQNRLYEAFIYSFGLSILAAVSWLILMPGHALPHTHLNGIIFYIPLLMICYIVISISLMTYVRRRGLLKTRKG